MWRRWAWVALLTGITAGCATKPGSAAFDGQQAAARGQFFEASLKLREAVETLPTHAEHDAQRHRLMMELARAQLCTSVGMREPGLATATGDMLRDYEQVQRDRSEGTAAQRSRLRQTERAQREASLAQDEPRTWAVARCRSFRRNHNTRPAGSLEVAFLLDRPVNVYRRPRRATRYYGRPAW